MRTAITREEAMNMEDAHGQGLHEELPRDGCPICMRRELSSYPTAAELAAHKGEPPGSLDTLSALNEHEREQRKAEPDALSAFESACNVIALVFPTNSAQRRIALQARGDMREANGEART